MNESLRRSQTPSLLSIDTILILSTLLIGVALGRVPEEASSQELLYCGIAGALAYVAFRVAGQKRGEQLALAERSLTEQRLDRHVYYLDPNATDESLRRQAQDVDLISI